MLLAVAVVPWLGDLFRSIEVPGVARIEFRDVERRVEAAQRTADAALVGDGPEGVAADDTAAWETVEELATEYVAVRLEQRSGAARTRRMDQIFARMVRATQRVDDFDTGELLRSRDAGRRLAAYARLYALPEPGLLSELVEAVAGEPLPFNQYWGLRAVGKGVEDAGADGVPPGVVGRLQELRSRVLLRSDRGELVDGILADLGGGR
ncbi:hypothetical protein BIV25_29760 [Streptomyces sp. MUSC 14]|nr:hypothetical protein BIV25_29760 [Streptomyces sp. MUSC 14]